MVNGYNLNNIHVRQIPYLRRTLGVIFQDFRLIEKKTVEENLTFIMRGSGCFSAGDPEAGVLCCNWWAWIIRATIPHRAWRGQQRVAIARALVNNPQVIVADRPSRKPGPQLVPWRS